MTPAGARAKDMLRGPCGNPTVLRVACWNVGIDAKLGGRYLKTEELRERLLTVLPPSFFTALLPQTVSTRLGVLTGRGGGLIRVLHLGSCVFPCKFQDSLARCPCGF